MKKTLLSIFSVALGFSLNAQTYFSEDFSGGLGQFTSTDADGDTFEWTAVDYAAGDGQGNVATSASWDGTQGPLTPDNWLISSAIDLSSATGTVMLEWVVIAQDQAWADENYTVYVANSNTPAALGASSTTFNEVIGTSSGYMARSLDVSAFAGQTIHVAFRHHNCTDWFRMNLDDISVRTIQANDVEMTSISSPTVSATGTNVTIAGTVTNKGANTITSLDVTWDDGSGVQSETFAVNIPTNGTYNFSHGTQLSVASAIAYNLNVCAAITGTVDGDPSNNCATHTVSGQGFVPTRHVVIEEGTGTWCGWCPRGAVAMETLNSDASRPNFIGIAVHNGDPMTVSAYDGGASFSGFPGMNVNRKYLGESVSTGAMESFYDQASAEPTNADIAVVATCDANGNISAEVTATFAATVTTEHRLAAVLVENGVTGGSGYEQSNYYSNQSQNLALTSPNSGGMPNFDWQAAANPVPASSMVYDHVGVALYGGYNGQANSITTPANANSSQSYTFTGSVGQSQAWNLHVVGMLINSSTGEIMNANEAGLQLLGMPEYSIINSFNVYPNPTSDFAVINFELNKMADVQISITDMTGKVVYSNELSNVSGVKSVSISAENMNNGIYFVNLISNGSKMSQKLTINK
jgi:hypothetical protein